MMIDADAKEGPAITSIEYRIDPKTAEEFLQAMKEMKQIRLRDGAIRWNLLRDSGDPERYLEIFVTESWGEHLRQHERITAEDREAEQRAQAFHVGYPLYSFWNEQSRIGHCSCRPLFAGSAYDPFSAVANVCEIRSLV